MSLAVYILYLLLACKIVVLISTNCILATSANLIIFCSWCWMLAIILIPYMILWYFFIQSFIIQDNNQIHIINSTGNIEVRKGQYGSELIDYLNRFLDVCELEMSN